MIPQWTNHLKDPEEKARFKKYIYGCKTLLERQTAIIDELESDLDSKESDPSQYNSPSWAALQADRNGYRRALRRIKQINNLDHKDDNAPL